MDTAQIRAILGDAWHGDNSLLAPFEWVNYVRWLCGDKTVRLEGDFTAAELEAIAAHMRAQGG